MKGNQPITLLTMAVLLLAQAVTKAETAVVTENNLNVRGKPSFSGEVITQLQKGEKVVVLEEITLSKPKPGEPTSWRRIQMPANTPVWVFAPFVDLNSKTVNVSRLNMRAGPGENFSIVGRLDRGQTVRDIRTVDDWMEVETPNSAEAFVASQFLVIEEAVSEEKEEPVDSSEPPPTPENDIEPTNSESPAESQETPPEEVPIPESETLVEETIQPAPALEPTETSFVPLPVPIIILDEEPSPPVTIIVPEELPRRRIVRREGIVRSTRSIQAPTYFELISKDTGKTINYLQVIKEGMELKTLKGKSIIITGEEGIESRWPKTPILRIETLELAP